MKKKKISCERHYITKRSFEHYVFRYSYGDTEYYECLICKDIREMQEKRYVEQRMLRDQQINKKWHDDRLRREERDRQRKINMESQLWDCYVAKEIIKGMGLKGHVKRQFINSLPKEFLQLARATIKLKRAIKCKIEDQERKHLILSREYKTINTPIMKCHTHGNCYERNVIKAGLSRWTGRQLYKCKRCMADLHQRHYEKNKEKVLIQQAEYRKNRMTQCQK